MAAASRSKASALGVSVGGKGANGGSGKDVTVNSYFAVDGAGAGVLQTPSFGQGGNVISIETVGDRSNGILAQSIGGGGGNGGFSGAGALNPGGVAIGLSVGGFGGGGATAGAVTVTSAQNILTNGNDSNGILAQSLGGGGGNGGFSLGVAAGSEFGGSASVGGFALSGGGSASLATVTSYGAIATKGRNSDGILAQSIGGGGGNGGFSIDGAFSMETAGVGLSVGGAGSVGGTAGAVIVDSYGYANGAAPTTPLKDGTGADVVTISTLGDNSNGIAAQSLGGGGGNGGFSAAGAVSLGGGAVAASVGGFGAGGGLAGDVTVVSVNTITTVGQQFQRRPGPVGWRRRRQRRLLAGSGGRLGVRGHAQRRRVRARRRRQRRHGEGDEHGRPDDRGLGVERHSRAIDRRLRR